MTIRSAIFTVETNTGARWEVDQSAPERGLGGISAIGGARARRAWCVGISGGGECGDDGDGDGRAAGSQTRAAGKVRALRALD